MKNKLIAMVLGAILPLASPTIAATYTYTGRPQEAFWRHDLDGQSINFVFSTPSALPANLTYDITHQASQLLYSVPVDSWSLTIGQYVLNSYRLGPFGLNTLGLQTDAQGIITGWAIIATEITSDGREVLYVSSQSPHVSASIFGPFADGVIVAHNAGLGGTVEFSQTNLSGVWTVGGTVLPSPGLPPAAPLGPVPEPQSWVLMLIGLGGVGAALRRRGFATVGLQASRI